MEVTGRGVAKARERCLRAFAIVLIPAGTLDERFEGRHTPGARRQAKPVIKKLLPDAALGPVHQGEHVVHQQIAPGAVVERRTAA